MVVSYNKSGKRNWSNRNGRKMHDGVNGIGNLCNEVRDGFNKGKITGGPLIGLGRERFNILNESFEKVNESNLIQNCEREQPRKNVMAEITNIEGKRNTIVGNKKFRTSVTYKRESSSPNKVVGDCKLRGNNKKERLTKPQLARSTSDDYGTTGWVLQQSV
ncbi:hypothetical protein ACOSP7_004816 [Xanthoceras sorbifolium]